MRKRGKGGVIESMLVVKRKMKMKMEMAEVWE